VVSGVGAGVQGACDTSKCFDLSKIRAKHPKNLGKISENPGKNGA